MTDITTEVETSGAGEAVPDASISLRDELANALKEANSRQETAEPQEPAETAEQKRARDEQGRFAKEQAEKAVEKVVAQQPVEQKPTVKAPDAWTADRKAKFAELPPDWQEYLTNREAEVHKGFTRQDEERTFARQVKEVINPYMPMIQAEGGNPTAAIQSLFNTAYILRHGSQDQKIQGLLATARQFGIDLASIPNVMAMQGQQPQVNPQVESLQQRLARLEQERQQEVQQRQMAEQATIQQTIESFQSEPGHEHFETVKSHMAALLQNGLAKDLQDAYDQAVYANPQTRSTLVAAQSQSAEAQRQADLKAKADAAKQAGGSVRGGPGGKAPVTAHQERSLRDELQANFRAAGSRA